MPGSYSRPDERPIAPARISLASIALMRATSAGVATRLKSSPITESRMLPWPTYMPTLTAAGDLLEAREVVGERERSSRRPGRL